MTVILGPVVTGSPTIKVTDKSSGKIYYKKQILPEGEYDYKGTKLDLSANRLRTFVQSFKDKAFDEVPFQFGGTESEHNNDPKLRGGTLAHMEHDPGKGLFGYFDFSSDPETAAYVDKYPRFGVSPRIELGIKRMDGKEFAGAIQHVCGTLVPRVNGMEPWGKVELSAAANTTDEVVDLSAEVMDVELPLVNLDTNEGGDSVAITLSEGEVNEFRKWVSENQIVNSMLDTLGAPVSPANTGNTGASDDIADKVRATADLALSQTNELRRDLARSRWETDAQALVRDGVPPAAIELARPVMERPDATVIELSSGQSTSDKAQLLGLLEGMKGTVPVGEIEKGHQVGALVDDEDTQESFDAWSADFRADFGL